MLKRGNETMKRPLVALTGLLLAQVLAQVDLALSPARLELVLPPGGEVTEVVRLTNGLDREEPLSVALKPFALTPQGEVAESPERNLCPHLTATPTAFTVPPRGTAEVRLT
jgi:P pilus assembly chaperone PapD